MAVVNVKSDVIANEDANLTGVPQTLNSVVVSSGPGARRPGPSCSPPERATTRSTASSA